MFSVAEELEQGLLLQGVTGIEDKLQAGVSDTLEALAHAGIKVRVDEMSQGKMIIKPKQNYN